MTKAKSRANSALAMLGVPFFLGLRVATAMLLHRRASSREADEARRAEARFDNGR